MDLNLGLVIILIGLGVFFLCLAASSFFVVNQGREAVVERFGKYNRSVKPGLGLKIPLVETVREINVQVQQLDVPVETKTKDNVFVTVKVSIQCMVTDPAKAIYRLTNANEQVSAYVFDVVRAEVPKLELDEVFDKKDDVANAVSRELTEAMDDFGYKILKALVTDVDPDAKVKAAMNEINAAHRMREAATAKAEAEQIALIKRAEAEAQSKKLQGQGMADQRRAIVDGLRASIAEFKGAVDGTTSQDVMALILTSQYFDTLKDLGQQGMNTILIPHSPGAVNDLQNQLLAAMQVGKTGNDKKNGKVS